MTRPPKPAREPGLSRFVFAWSAGRWRFQPRAKFAGVVKVGALCDSQAEASAEGARLYDMLRRRDPRAPQTIGAAFARVAADERAEGAEERTVLGHYEHPAKAITSRYWSADSPIDGIDVDEVVWMIDRALAEPLVPDTIRRYLQLITRACLVAGVPDPVPEAKRKRRKALRTVPSRARVDLQFFRPEEVGLLLERMRTWTCHVEAPHQATQVALVSLLAWTGIRSGEASRLVARDLDLERRMLTVRVAKVRARPRRIPLAGLGLDAAAELVAGKGPEDYVVPSLGAGAAKCPRQHFLNRTFEEWKRRLDEPRMNGRTLRHTFATTLLLNGATVAEVAELLGHSPTSTSTMRYLHALQSGLVDHVSGLGRAYGVPGA